MANKIGAAITNFITFKIMNRVLVAIGFLIQPFSKVSGNPVLDKAEFPWAKLLEENAEKIRTEAAAVLKTSQHLPNIQDIQPAESALTTDNNWKTFFLYGFGLKADKNCERCPETARVLEQIPGMLTGFFSILYPSKHIPPHRGIFKGIVRTHLGLIVPKTKQPDDLRMRVGKETVYWQNGKAVFFDDTYVHEVWNNSDGIRVVLLIDTERPYSKFATKINKAIIKSITESVYVKNALQKNEDWEKVYYNVFP